MSTITDKTLTEALSSSAGTAELDYESNYVPSKDFVYKSV